MPNRGWTYLTNPFNAATEGSFRAMLKIGEFTVDALESRIPPPSLTASLTDDPPLPPDELALYVKLRNDLKPLLLDYTNRYDVWKMSYSDRKGQTTRLTDMFNQLRSEKIQEWDVVIQTYFKPKTAEYQQLLPQRRAPFQSGPYRNRLEALKIFSKQVAKNTTLDEDFKTEIQNFYGDLETEYHKQNTEKTDTNFSSRNLEPSRRALAKGLFSALGAMINYFSDDSDKIKVFFDLEAIRVSEQTIFRHGIKPLQTLNAVYRSLTDNDMLRLRNDGGAELIFWLALNPKDGPGDEFVKLDPDTDKTVSPEELGSTTGKYLNVKNTSDAAQGHYVITIM